MQCKVCRQGRQAGKPYLVKVRVCFCILFVVSAISLSRMSWIGMDWIGLH